MLRSHGDHLKWNEVKAGIIEFIISSDGAVPEPKIREFLAREYDIKDYGNIKKHLKDLQYRPYSSIEKIQGKPGLANRWDIKRIENLKNIRIHFPEIRLNRYKKSLNMISDQLAWIPGALNANRFFIQLYLSVSFFDMCLKNEVGTLYAKADEIYKMSLSGTFWTHLLPIASPTSKLYTEFMKRILANPNIWLEVYSECINNSLKSEICQKSLKLPADIEMLEETFQKIVEGSLPIEYEEISVEELYKLMIENISFKMASEVMALNMPKEMHLELLKRPNDMLVEQANLVKKISEEILNRILVDENWKETYREILQIITFEQNRKIISIELLFDHCFQSDILDGTASTEEKEFVQENSKFFNIMNEKSDKYWSPLAEDYDVFLDHFFEKCIAKVGTL